MEIGGISILVAFLAGLESCLSPCVLPTGGFVTPVGVVDWRAPLLHGAALTAGFALLFTALGASVGLVGFVLQEISCRYCSGSAASSSSPQASR